MIKDTFNKISLIKKFSGTTKTLVSTIYLFYDQFTSNIFFVFWGKMQYFVGFEFHEKKFFEKNYIINNLSFFIDNQGLFSSNFRGKINLFLNF